MQSIVNSAVFNTINPACNDATVGNVRTCTSQTLRTLPDGTVATVTNWLWADMTHISPAGHSNLGALAVTRANGNPF